MKNRLIVFCPFVLSAILLSLPLAAQLPPLRFDEGPIGLGVALRRLDVTGSVLHITAHPDDEDNALLVMLNRGRGVRTGLLTLTRGDGGQNEIGPELFESLGIIRTEELMSMHRYDGAEQYFTRAFEFGYSFSVEETLEKWGKEATLGDIVEIIRRFRPDVILTLPRQGTGGGQHHQASAILATEAFRAAADPRRFPEQGLAPWQASKIYERYRWSGGGGGTAPEDTRDVLRMETGVFDPMLGQSYAEIGTLARGYHRCQGMAQLTALPGERFSTWKLVDSVTGPGTAQGLFDGIDTTLSRIVELAGGTGRPIAEGVGAIQAAVRSARESYSAADPEAAAAPLARGLSFVRSLRQRVSGSPLHERERAQIEFLLSHKEAEFERALGLAHQIRLQALADDGLVIPGQQLEVGVNLAYGGRSEIGIGALELVAPSGWTTEAAGAVPGSLEAGAVVDQAWQVRVSPEAPVTQPYWYRATPDDNRFQLRNPEAFGAPWGPPPLVARLSYVSHGVRASLDRPVQYRYPGPWVGGEQRHTLMVVPALSVGVDPGIQILPEASAAEGFTVAVTSTYNGKESSPAVVSLRLPAGWNSRPEQARIEFDREGESRTTSFRVTPRDGVASGRHRLVAVARLGGREYTTGHDFIDYDHIQKRVIYEPATTQVEVLDVRVTSGLRVGYIEGVGDHVPAALRQLGVEVEFLDGEALAGDLSRFDTIVTGVRAYLVREDLKAHNARLLDWVESGGTLIVQYNKLEFNGETRRRRGETPVSPYAPLPVAVGRGRVTDENAPIRLLEPRHPVFTSPNAIGPTDWAGWVQERGLYFLGEKDPRYRDLLITADPFEYNSGDKPGALVELRHGEGRWVYVGLGLWRQLPAGVPGAYRLLANLVSLGE